MKNRTLILTALLLISAGLSGQDDSYILKRVTGKSVASSVNISPDGSLLLVGYQDGSFKVMDPVSLEPVFHIEGAHSKAVNAMDMTPKMDLILTAGDRTIKLWDRTGKHVGNLNAHATTIWNTDISGDGKHVVSSAFNKTFLLWDLYEGVVLEKMQGHEDVTMSVAFSPDDRFIASGSNDLTVKIWDVESRQVVSSLHGPTQDIYDVAFNPDGDLLAVASKDRSVRIYHLEGEKLLYLLKGHRDMVLEVSFSPDGEYLVTASADQSVYLWDLTSGERIHAFLDNEEAVLDVVFHPDGKSFYSISFAGDLTRWAIHPEIFVLNHFEKEYREELAADPLFEPRRKGESKKDFQARKAEADIQKAGILEKFYARYLENRQLP